MCRIAAGAHGALRGAQPRRRRRAREVAAASCRSFGLGNSRAICLASGSVAPTAACGFGGLAPREPMT